MGYKSSSKELIGWMKELGLMYDVEYHGNENVTLDPNMITLDGLRVVYNTIRDISCEINRLHNFHLDLPNPVNLVGRGEGDWLVYRDKKKRAWGKRYGDYIYQLAKIKLGGDYISRIGECASRVSGLHCPTDWCFDFHSNSDWKCGAFGNHGSCWWGDWNLAREVCHEQAGVFAMRFYEPSKGRGEGIKGSGRVWIVPDEHDQIYLFNSYAGNLSTIGNMLISWFNDIAKSKGLDYSFNYEWQDLSGDLWINGNDALCISQHGEVLHVDDGLRITLEIPQNRCCYNCDEYWNENEMICDQNGYFICPDCISESYNVCNCCEDYVLTCYLRKTFEENYYCARCLENGRITLHVCEFCGMCVESDFTISEDDHIACSDCVSKRFIACDTCGLLFLDEAMIAAEDGLLYCSQSCINANLEVVNG